MKKLSTFLLSLFFLQAIAQIPAGYYDGTATLAGPQLKTKLSQIITNGHKDKGYDGLYTAYPTTDTDRYYENDGTVLDMYSENPTGPDPYNFQHGKKKCGSYSNEGDCYNREHVVPQSLFGKKAPMVSDVHHIRPTDGKVNGIRSNYPFGKVQSATTVTKNGSKLGASGSAGYGGTVFEPIDEFKGDVARMIFYFVTRYESQLSNFNSGGMLGGSAYPGLEPWELNVLLQWAQQDPVSPAEIDRNNASYTFQGNRNPFIDHPEWIDRIWGTQIVDNEAPTAPANLAVSDVTTNSATLTWTASTDNIGVAAYKIFANGEFKQSISGTTAVVTGLNQGTEYSFYVIAADAAGNESAPSGTVTATTLVDTEAPTAPTNLTVVNTGSNEVKIQWTASTDNVAVTGYEIFVNNVSFGSVSGVTAMVTDLQPLTTYTMYVVAKDAAGNVSAASNMITVTTGEVGTDCGNETFDNIPAASGSSYATREWSSNGLDWTATDARTDQTIDGKAITVRAGYLEVEDAPNGIGDLTVTTQLKFGGTSGTFKVFVNDVDTGKTIPYSAAVTTTTITGINIAGPVTIRLDKSGDNNRVAVDNMMWTCFSTMGTDESSKNQNVLRVYPNPVRNGILKLEGAQLDTIKSVQIYDISGKLMQTLKQPFKTSNSIRLQNLPKGVYILKADEQSTKFIVQ